MIRFTPTLLLLAAAAAPAGAQAPADPAPVASDQVRLEYRFDRLAGKVAVYTIETEQRVGQELHGKAQGEVRTWMRQTLEQRFEAPRGGADGGLGRVVVTPRRFEARLEEPGRTVRYDSKEGGAAGPFAPLAGKVDKPVTLELTRLGEVKGVRGVPVSERASYRDAFLELPEQALDLGDSWDRLDRKPMELLGTLAYHFTYRLDAVEPGAPALRRVSATIRARLEDVPPNPTTSIRLTDQHGAGGLVLDEDGLTRESTLESRLEITVKSASGTQVQRLTTRTRQTLVEVRDAANDPPPAPPGRARR
ncbi:MAG: hypothetical protein M9894_35280 [Planctomycetes bacterium]|nr:hypothetical protein [Planctomycetota bacterium]